MSIGDRVITASGEVHSIRWIGHRAMACRDRKDAIPVRIAAHALGEGKPARDLFVSPPVAVDVLGEVLIPAVRLIDGTTITQIEVESVTDCHVDPWKPPPRLRSTRQDEGGDRTLPHATATGSRSDNAT